MLDVVHRTARLAAMSAHQLGYQSKQSTQCSTAAEACSRLHDRAAAAAANWCGLIGVPTSSCEWAYVGIIPPTLVQGGRRRDTA